MIKIDRFSYGTQMNCDRENIHYSTFIPVHYISYSLSEIDKEIENNNFGALTYEVSKCDFWKAPIINMDFEIPAGKGWEEKDGVFSYSAASRVETVSVAILGYIDRSARTKYYNDIANKLSFDSEIEYSSEKTSMRELVGKFCAFRLYFKNCDREGFFISEIVGISKSYHDSLVAMRSAEFCVAYSA